LRTLLGALAFLFALSPTAHAGEVTVFTGGIYRKVQVASLKELQFQGAVQQQYDFSCGAAAVATLLSHHYDKPTNETKVFKEMWVNGDQESIQKVGFSLYDMKTYLRAHGYAADGFRVTLDQLYKARLPAIALVEIDGYSHFVVIKGVSPTEVLIGDPAMGVRLLPRAEFKQIRDEVLLVIRNHIEVARESFNHEDDWQLQPRTPVRVAVGRGGLGSFTMLLPTHNEF
jgi:predicted double-glycine peptidase